MPLCMVIWPESLALFRTHYALDERRHKSLLCSKHDSFFVVGDGAVQKPVTVSVFSFKHFTFN